MSTAPTSASPVSSPIRFPVSKPLFTAKEHELLSLVIQNQQVTQGPLVHQFEQEFAKTVGSKFAVSCTSGTTALHLALAALDLKPDDEVIVPDLTYVATANAVRYTGAKVVLCDVDPNTWNLDPEAFQRCITGRTRVVLPVHLYGVPCDMRSILDVAKRRAIHVVEDAAEGLGGSHKDQALGTFGCMGTFSFYGNKIMTTGEGGMVVTDDEKLHAKLVHLRGMCQTAQRYHHDGVGFNYRMTEMQGALGIAQLDGLKNRIERRHQVVNRYLTNLAVTFRRFGCEMQRIYRADDQVAPWLFTFHCKQRHALMAALCDVGIETRPTFIPMHKLPPYACAGSWTSDMVHGMSLPTYPQLCNDDVDLISDALIKALEHYQG